MSLKLKILIVVSLTILISMAVTTSIISSEVRKSSQQFSIAIVEQTSEHFASEIKLVLEKAMTAVKTLELSFWQAKKDNMPRRGLDAMLVESIHQDSDIFGTWMLWEPNAYDDQDKDFANTAGHGKTGRVNSYWHWEGSKIINEPNVDWQEASWYNTPRIRGRETLENPYYYQVSDRQQLLISVIQPITRDDGFHGVVGVDVSLESLQNLVRKIKVQNAGYAELIAFNGMFVAHPDDALIGKVTDDETLASIRSGSLVQGIYFNKYLNESVYRMQLPISVAKTDTPWSLIIHVPMNVIEASGDDIGNLITIISMASGLLLLLLLWFFVDKEMAPLIQLTDKIKENTSSGSGQIAKIKITSAGEIATLVDAFNHMADDLNASRQALLDINADLEHRVYSRTEQLQHALEQQQLMQDQLVETEKMASLGSLVAGVAHEINTPISIALTGASHYRELAKELVEKHTQGQLKKSEFDEFVVVSSQISEMIESNIHRASTLIGNFKMVAVDRSHEEIRKIQLDSYLASVLTSLQPNFKKYQANLTTDIEEGLFVYCDPGALSHILSNAIMNSFIHAFEDQQDKKITVSCHQLENQIQLEISDNGIGMSAEVKEKVFEPFYTTKRGHGGSGLGMHIIYNMVTHKLGGKISVESEPGQGTTIFITFHVKGAQIQHHELLN